MAMDGDKAFLPREIIIEILKRLPVKSLVRFKSVCKDWKNLFKTPSFIADHLHHSGQRNPLLLLQLLHYRCDSLQLCLLDSKMDVLEVQNTPLINSLSCATIVGSSNGLLCIRRPAYIGPLHSLFVWNPAVTEVREVSGSLNNFEGVCYVGFGFSPTVNDYKIVKICYPELCDEKGALDLSKICVNRVEVYSLSTGSWKEIEFGNIQSVRLHSEPVTANGAMFWLGLEMGISDEDESDVVVSFDIAMEVFTLLPMAASASKSNYDKLTVYENKLAMFSHFVIGNFESSLFYLWVMEEGTGAFGESWTWTKKYTIGPISGLLCPLSIWRNEIVCYVDETPGPKYGEVNSVLSLLNPTTIELKKFPSRRYGYRYVIFNYIESLVPVGNIHIEEPSC